MNKNTFGWNQCTCWGVTCHAHMVTTDVGYILAAPVYGATALSRAKWVLEGRLDLYKLFKLEPVCVFNGK